MKDVNYGRQTALALENFNITDKRVNRRLIGAMLQIKEAAAAAHKELGLMEPALADAIVAACRLAEQGEVDDLFVTTAWQGGAGTSTNMNVNEVIASLAEKVAGNGLKVDPLDDVNRGQSTNDVYPTALRIAAIGLVRELADACSRLQEALQQKENEYETVVKLGRTELMDALPMTLGQEFGAYAQAIARDRWRIYKVEERLRQINLGGTAMGTGSAADRQYGFLVIEKLRRMTEMGLARAEYPIDLTQNNDVFVEVSGLLKALAVNLMKIATDLRLMNSGPGGGLGEIRLKALQAGSTIMPGKVNPVIPEMVTQVAIKVMAGDSAIATAAACGNFELNAFLPLIADTLLENLELLSKTVDIFRTKCIEVLEADPAACRRHLENSMALAATLMPLLGYAVTAEVIETAQGDPRQVPAIILEQGLMDEEDLRRVMDSHFGATYLKKEEKISGERK